MENVTDLECLKNKISLLSNSQCASREQDNNHMIISEIIHGSHSDDELLSAISSFIKKNKISWASLHAKVERMYAYQNRILHTKISNDFKKNTPNLGTTFLNDDLDLCVYEYVKMEK